MSELAPTSGPSPASAPADAPPVPLRRPRGAHRAAPPPEPEQIPPATPTTGALRLLLAPVTGSLRLGRARLDVAQRLRADWPRCRAHGLCAEIAPEIVHLDEWGYPLFDPSPVSGEHLAAARKAVQVCPTLALRLVEPRR